MQDLLTELEALVDTFRQEDVNLVKRLICVLENFIQQKLGADVEEVSSLQQPPGKSDVLYTSTLVTDGAEPICSCLNYRVQKMSYTSNRSHV